MGTYTGSDKRLAYLFEHGGGGGGGSFTCDLLYENTNFAAASGNTNVDKIYTLAESIDDYDAVLVTAYLYSAMDGKHALDMTMLIMKEDYYLRAPSQSQGTFYYVSNAFILNGSFNNYTRRFFFGFNDNVTLYTTANRSQDEEPILYKVYGLKLGGSGHTYSTTEQVVGTWIDGKPLYERTYDVTNYMPSSSNYDGSMALHLIDPESGTGTYTSYYKDFDIDTNFKVKFIKGFGNTAGNSNRPFFVGGIYPSNRYQVNIRDLGTGKIRIMDSRDFPGFYAEAYITIQYTKTTD